MLASAWFHRCTGTCDHPLLLTCTYRNLGVNQRKSCPSLQPVWFFSAQTTRDPAHHRAGSPYSSVLLRSRSVIGGGDQVGGGGVIGVLEGAASTHTRRTRRVSTFPQVKRLTHTRAHATHTRLWRMFPQVRGQIAGRKHTFAHTAGVFGRRSRGKRGSRGERRSADTRLVTEREVSTRTPSRGCVLSQPCRC